MCVLHLPHNVSCWRRRRRRRRRRCTHALKNRFHAQALSSVYRSTLSPPLLNSGQHLISSCRKESQSFNFQFATWYAIDVIVTESILPAKNISLSCAPSKYLCKSLRINFPEVKSFPMIRQGCNPWHMSQGGAGPRGQPGLGQGVLRGGGLDQPATTLVRLMRAKWHQPAALVLLLLLLVQPSLPLEGSCNHSRQVWNQSSRRLKSQMI